MASEYNVGAFSRYCVYLIYLRKKGFYIMDHACNIGFTDGTHLALDGYDEIFFYNEIPNIELEYTAYSLQREQYKPSR